MIPRSNIDYLWLVEHKDTKNKANNIILSPRVKSLSQESLILRPSVAYTL